MVLLAGVASAQIAADSMISPFVRDVVFLGSLLGTVLLIACLKSADAYTPKSLAMPRRWPLRVLSIGAGACLVTGFFLTTLSVGPHWSWALIWALCTVVALILSRMVLVPVLKSWMPSEGFHRLVAVVGADNEADHDLDSLDRDLSARFDRDCTCRVYARPKTYRVSMASDGSSSFILMGLKRSLYSRHFTTIESGSMTLSVPWKCFRFGSAWQSLDRPLTRINRVMSMLL